MVLYSEHPQLSVLEARLQPVYVIYLVMSGISEYGNKALTDAQVGSQS